MISTELENGAFATSEAKAHQKQRDEKAKA
jgi:hypothetical protein